MDGTYKFHPDGIFSISKNDVELQPSENKGDKYGAEFETAIANTGFGKFNYLLLLIAFPTALAPGFETTTMSFVGPGAGCYLKISLIQKGLLNASTYIGMISSAFLWGYLSDAFGRKKLLILGLFLTACSDTIGALSQNYIFLLICRFSSGFAVCGPFAVLVTYLSELHSAKYRSKIVMLSGTFISTGNLIIPFIAWWIIPKDILFTLFDTLKIHSWNVFIAITAIPSVISMIAITFLPESPKFLMTSGNNKRALSIFQGIYAMNTNRPKKSYPIKSLIDETEKRNPVINNGEDRCSQFKSLWYPPHISKLILVVTIQFCSMLGGNTLRLWLPQMFTTIDMYGRNHPNSTGSICTILEELAQKSSNHTCSNTDDHMNGIVFKNSIIVALCTTIGYAIISAVITEFDKKKLMVFLYIISTICGLVNYFSRSVFITLTFSSIYVTFAAISSTMILSFVVDLFPTYLRTMTVSLAMMSGRCGVIIGNYLFPLLLETGCLPPFLMITVIVISILHIFTTTYKSINDKVCAFLTLLLPPANMKPLE